MTGPQGGGTFDSVIVGGGAAGTELSRRVRENPGVIACVLESRPPERLPCVHVPAGFIKWGR